MDEEAEKDDDLIEPFGVTGLREVAAVSRVGRASSPRKNAGILGLDERFRSDAAIAGSVRAD